MIPVAFTRRQVGRNKRLAKLAGGVAVIKVGAQTEVAMKEKKLRVEDAMNATRAAVEEGIVAGGGTAQVNAIPAVEALIATLHGDEKTGAKIVASAVRRSCPVAKVMTASSTSGSALNLASISAAQLAQSRFRMR